MNDKLTPEQLSVMYDDSDDVDQIDNNVDTTIDLTQAKNYAIIDINSKKIIVPTNQAFEQLVKENKFLKTEISNLIRDVRNLKSAMKVLNRNYTFLNDDLNNKVDKIE